MDNGEQNGNGQKRRFWGRVKTLFGLRSGNTLRETVEEAIEEHEASNEVVTDDNETTMLRNVLTFSELDVEDVMIPRADIIWVDSKIELDELNKVIADKTHTRMPICKGSLDDVIGFLHTKDLVSVISNEEPFVLRKMMREALFVPPSMKATALLVKMQMSRVHMALVVDEYGGTYGLVTLEDLMEEIVGEIADEHDPEEELLIVRRGVHQYEVSARAEVAVVEEELGVTLKDDTVPVDVDTIGGLISSLLSRVPVKGEIVPHEALGGEFEILDADPRRIKRVLIRWTPEDEGEDGTE